MGGWGLSEEMIKSILEDFGATETEAEIYLILSEYGALKGTDLAKIVKKDKAQVYHILRNLQTKSLVESTLQTPVHFSPIPFERVVELAIKAKRDETAQINSIKKQAIVYWRSLRRTETQLCEEKIGVLKGRTKIYSKIAQMIVEICRKISKITGLKEVALSGGVLQNRLLLVKSLSLLESAGFKVYTHHQAPCNDGGVSLGQAVIAANQEG